MNKFLTLLAVSLLLVCFAASSARAADNDRPANPPQKPGNDRAAPAGGGAPMLFGGPFGGRDPIADFISNLGELNLTPEFDLTREQKEKIHATRKDLIDRQAQWRAEHADELRKIQEQMMALFAPGRGGPPAPEKYLAVNKLREEVMSTSPDANAAVDRMMAILTDDQRTPFETFRDDPARQPQGFGGFGPAASVPKGNELPADNIPQKPGFYRLKYKASIPTAAATRQVTMAYVLYIPQGYDSSKDKFPVLVFLHGAGEAGMDGNAVFNLGPAMELQRQGEGSAFAKKFPFILICPQCPPRGERWDQPVMLKAVEALLDDVNGKVRADPDRVYVTGLSMGGKGTWLLSMQVPQRFAAIAPIAADTLDVQGAARLKNVATWAIVGALDFGGAAESNQKMVDAIKTAGGDSKITIVPNEGHAVWPRYYADPSFYDWFLTHKREKAAKPRE